MLPKGKIIIVFLLLAGLLTIHVAFLLDDPDHFFHPKQDCPLCQADKTIVPLTVDASVYQTDFIQLFTLTNHYDLIYYNLCLSIDSIRAPPSLANTFIS
jgi:hypothetical protein